ncbi:MAG: ABC transporter substrate-binding protein [Desulfobacteraceae bacterium]|nr:ABC transporter substrate-binding protein [Desulfobacteraceae bacterium]
MKKHQNLIKWILIFIFAFFLNPVFAGADCKSVYGNGPNKFSVATGSPGELGLLEVLADSFNKKHDSAMCWIKAGSGKSLKLLKEKKADAIMVHAPKAEKKAVQEGWAIKRKLIGSNEFYIVGPVNDPAQIAKAKSAADAYARIAGAKSDFLSRGDNSGTHKKEMFLWEKAKIKPSGKWYIITKNFMMATLKKANEINGYFMTDSSTWVAAKKELPNLKILFRGDPILINVYHGLCQPRNATAGQPLASEFIDFIGSDEAQTIIREYGKALYGDGLYNDAKYAEQYEH